MSDKGVVVHAARQCARPGAQRSDGCCAYERIEGEGDTHSCTSSRATSSGLSAALSRPSMPVTSNTLHPEERGGSGGGRVVGACCRGRRLQGRPVKRS